MEHVCAGCLTQVTMSLYFGRLVSAGVGTMDIYTHVSIKRVLCEQDTHLH